MMVLTALALTGCQRQASSGLTFGPATVVSAATGVGTTPMFALSPRGMRAIAWVSAEHGGTEGQLNVSVDGTTPTALRDPLASIQVHSEAPPRIAFGPDNTLYALYAVAKDVGKRFPVSALRFVRSTDGGHTWSAPVTITDDPAELGSHNFHALYVAQDGTLYATWLDGREGKSATYMTHSTDGGKSWAKNQRLSVGETCPCCRTAVTANAHGLVYVAWRTVLPGNVRDVVVARSTDYGATWNAPVRVHADDWVFGGCPHAGPSMQLDAEGRLHVLWWTGRPGKSGVYYAVSSDSGKSFRAPVTIDMQQVPLASHVQLSVGKNHQVVAVWDAVRANQPTVQLRVSRNGGATFDSPVQVSDNSHAAQYPVVSLANDTVSIAWSQTAPASEGATHETPHEMSHAGMEHTDHHGGMHAVGSTQVIMRQGALAP